MKEPYATMLGPLRDHWIIGEYLTEDEPDWSGLVTDDRMDSLSVGEKVLLDFAAAWANTQIYLDDEYRYRVGYGLSRFYGWEL